jgi:hypothetical protein
VEKTTDQVAEIARRARAIISIFIRFFGGFFDNIAHRLASGRLAQRFARLGRWRIVLVALLLVAFVAPTAAIGVTAYSQYRQLKNWGLDGVHQLLAVKDIVSGALSPSPAGSATASSGATATPTTRPGATPTPSAGSTEGLTQKANDLLSSATLAQIKQHCDAAESDFQRVNTAVAQRQGVIGIGLLTPYAGTIHAVGQLATMGIEISGLCSRMTLVGKDFTQSFATSPFSSQGGPILTQKSFADLQSAVDDVQATLTEVQDQLQQTNLSILPLSASQRAQLEHYLPDLPKALNDIATFKPYLPLAGWALGVDSPRTYLIQTMDRSELRPSGGFNGDYGTLTVNGGRVGSISLTDVSEIYPIGGPLAPEPYTSWWPFPNWGLRDANLSGDFPTSAKLAMGAFTAVTNIKVDGSIMFSPLVIERLLDPKILGPLYISCYDVTITETNLEDELHYFQLSSAGLAKQNECSANVQGTTKRKRFTSALAQDLQDRVRSASQSQLRLILDSLRQDIVTKDLEIYVNDPQLESLLTKDNLNDAAVADPSVDATYVVQANVSVNKGSPFVKAVQMEYISLDSQGGAYHTLILQLTYNPTGPIYGVSTYRDYVRVYVPQDAVFIDGQGFDETSQPPLCYLAKPAKDGKLPNPKPPPGGGTPIPYYPANAPCQPAQSAVCSTGLFVPTQAPFSVGDTEGSSTDHIDQIGRPNNFTSDIPGRAMFGGLVVVPAFCEGAIVLQWYVPHVAGTSAHDNLPYTLIEQRQSGADVELMLHIAPAAGTKATPIDKTIAAADSGAATSFDRDLTFTLTKPAKH